MSALPLVGESLGLSFEAPDLPFLVDHISSRSAGRHIQDSECLVLSSMPDTEKEFHKSQLIPSRGKRKLA